MNTALIVIDLQHAFCHPDGSYARRGYELLELESTIRRCRRLVRHGRQAGWPVFCTRVVFQSDYADAGRLLADHPEIRELNAYRIGTADCELISELAAGPDETVDKTRFDAFCQTELEARLRAQAVAHLVVCGVLTNVCVESTVRSGYDRGFRITVVSDAVTTYAQELQKASLTTMARHFARICSLDQLLDQSRVGEL